MIPRKVLNKLKNLEISLARELATFVTFKKDTTLERQGRFTLSTLQGGARAGEFLYIKA